MSKKLFVSFFIAVLVLVGVGIWLGIYLGQIQSGNSVSPYSAVYLSTGDIYFGKLSWFPTLRLNNVWFLQRGADANQNPQFAIAPLTATFWGPSDELFLNAKDVVFTVRLRADSQVVQAIEGRTSQSQQNSLGQIAPQGNESEGFGNISPAQDESEQ